MTKANSLSITKDNPAIQRAGQKLRALIPVNLRLDNQRKRRYPKKEIAAIDAKYGKFYNPFKGFPADKARLRSAEYAKAYKKRGYLQAERKSHRSDCELIKLSKRVIRMKPRGLNDLAMQLSAIDFLRFIYDMDYAHPSEDFALHFANLCGVKLYAPKGGGK